MKKIDKIRAGNVFNHVGDLLVENDIEVGAAANITGTLIVPITIKDNGFS